MSIDFDKPTLSTLKADYLTYIRDNIIAALKMDYSGGSNIPTGAIRWNSVGQKFEIYNGSAWGDLATYFAIEVSNLYGMTASIVEINTAIDGILATSAELNKAADGIGEDFPRRISANIGDWNMGSTPYVEVDLSSLGITLDKMLGIASVHIREDAALDGYKLPLDRVHTDVPDGSYMLREDTISGNPEAYLTRENGGYFDTSGRFDNTSYNRGWIIIEYID